MRKYDMFWKSNPDWFDYDDDLFPILTDQAPEEARESYRNYLKQKGYAEEEICTARSSFPCGLSPAVQT